MSLVHFNFYSKNLKNNTDVDIILPDLQNSDDPKEFYTSGKKYPVLWLLHGTYGDYSDWLRRTSIELYAIERDIIVVMPSALNSNYSNWEKYMMGYNMYDFLTEELMPLVHNWFPASDKREDNFIAGLSMGGRGTIKFAVNHPELWSAAAVLSAAPIDMSKMEVGHPSAFLNPENPRTAISIKNAGGFDAYVNGVENVWKIIDEKAGTGELPRLMFACGEDDVMIFENYKKFKAHCEEIGLEAEWLSVPGYRHEWRFWDLAIQHALDFFGIERKRRI